MLKLAIEADARFSLDAHELRQGGASYTINLLERYKRRFPQCKLFFMLGADAALTLPLWKDVGRFREFCTLVVYPRPDAPSFADGLPHALAGLDLRWEYAPFELWPVSSSEIRRRIREGRPVRYYLPDTVVDYIHHHRLYQD
jgi:nicotinate-nucleotide adenylyltransferase